ncbi:MAG: type II secretion system F family protein, partial [Planctomycetia bacterium]|nr:type II secretion system F family protein [Planctomycetia bacterium]
LGQLERAEHVTTLFLSMWLFLVVVLPITLIMFWPFIFYFLALNRVSRRQSLGILIRNCLESKLPLPMAIRTYAATSYSPFYRGKLLRFATALESGTSLTDAVTRFHGLLPAETVRLIQLQANPNDAVRLMSEAFTFENERSFIYTYSVARLTYILILLWLFFIECQVHFPVVSELVNEYCYDSAFEIPLICRTFESYCKQTHVWNRLLAFVVPILALSGLLLKLGYFSWRQIFVRHFFWESDCAALLRFLSAAVARNVSFSNALTIYETTLGSRFLRRKTEKIHTAIDAGTQWIDAMEKSRIVTQPEAKLLETAQRTGNTDVVLAQLARDKESRQNRLDDFWSKLAFMIAILLLGCLTAFYALAIFMPLNQLIHHLCLS